MGDLIHIDVDFKALEAAYKGLEKFPDILKEEFGKALTELVLYIEKVAKEKCPVSPEKTGGGLRASIHAEIESWFEGYVGSNKEYLPWVEFGTDPHPIPAKNKKALAFEKDGETILRKTVQHPGTPAQPFMEPAYEAGKKKAPEIFRKAYERAERRLERLMKS